MTSPILTAGPIARSRNGVIGRDGALPWRLKSDMAIFRAVTAAQIQETGFSRMRVTGAGAPSRTYHQRGVESFMRAAAA